MNSDDRNERKHENIKPDNSTNIATAAAADNIETNSNQGDKWLASLTNKISSLENNDQNKPSRGWSEAIINKPASEDPLDNEWAALANRNEAKTAKNNNNNPFIAFV